MSLGLGKWGFNKGNRGSSLAKRPLAGKGTEEVAPPGRDDLEEHPKNTIEWWDQTRLVRPFPDPDNREMRRWVPKTPSGLSKCP